MKRFRNFTFKQLIIHLTNRYIIEISRPFSIIHGQVMRLTKHITSNCIVCKSFKECFFYNMIFN